MCGLFCSAHVCKDTPPGLKRTESEIKPAIYRGPCPEADLEEIKNNGTVRILRQGPVMVMVMVKDV